jgi:hypothetical protein
MHASEKSAGRLDSFTESRQHERAVRGLDVENKIDSLHARRILWCENQALGRVRNRAL